ncbi:MAG: hypothetical protein K5707_04175 [Clostridia bacterium]|nr:hypothetical protein [Clostridia bacterium]
MISGKTESGFEFELDEAVLDDMELLENLIALDKGEWQVLPAIVQGILGAEQKQKLYDYCRDEKTGRVSLRKVTNEVKELFSSVKTVKK